jgi:hypothetical protein
MVETAEAVGGKRIQDYAHGIESFALGSIPLEGRQKLTQGLVRTTARTS